MASLWYARRMYTPQSFHQSADAFFRVILVPFLLLCLLGVAGCGPEKTNAPETSDAVTASATIAQTAPAEYLGSASCADCHEQQWQSWQDSHHDLALQAANPETVLANFTSNHGQVSFEQDGERFFITPERNSERLEVRYTFGVEPLQQYVVALPSGQMQVLPVPWDTRDASDGGQRWYELYPGDNPPGDPMHWQGRANNWNGMCADCHSTAVRKNYDHENRTYNTTFSEADVGCEACHGPGSAHVEAAKTGLSVPLPALNSQQTEINVCAQCHSRRSQLAEGFTSTESYFDHYLPSLLRQGLYHPDGQILEEVYVYGSFLQSKMHHAGVTCSNCHDAHSSKLKLPDNQTCTQCHNPQGRADFATLNPASYDDPAHHHHPQGSAGAQCVNCHMTSEVYMGVDDRRDHSFRIPRPDLSSTLGTPNACAKCHQDQDNAELVSTFEQWFGPQPAHFGETFAKAQRRDPLAESELAALAKDDTVPIMIRANAVALMAGYARGYSLDTLREASRAEHPLLRIAATEGVAGLSPEAQWRYLLPLLEDQRLAVRHAAFSALMPTVNNPQQIATLRPYFSEYLESQELTADFPESLVNVANAYIAMGNNIEAETALDDALAIQANWIPALLNLADLYRATLRDPQGEALLSTALETAPELPEIQYSYALWLTRNTRSAEALEYFQQAAQLSPDDQRYGYTLALALNGAGNSRAAIDQLVGMLARWPDNDSVAVALVTILRDQGKNDAALRYLEPLLQRNPDNTQLRTLKQQLLRD
jgi:tetratricopeptide (TPR) repeat protein